MKNSLFIISKLCMLAFILLLAQGCQEDYEMIDPPMMTDYDDDLDEEVIMQKGLESYFVTIGRRKMQMVLPDTNNGCLMYFM